MDYTKDFDTSTKYFKEYLLGILACKIDNFRAFYSEKENRNGEGWKSIEVYKGKYKQDKVKIKIISDIDSDKWSILMVKHRC